MDLTEQYIKMCSKSAIIQKYFEDKYSEDKEEYPEISDYLIQGTIAVGISDGELCVWAYVNDERVYLPSQKQLQEMAGNILPSPSLLEYLARTHGHLWEEDLAYSWEMFWLCIVMKEKHKKVWNGEDWVVE